MSFERGNITTDTTQMPIHTMGKGLFLQDMVFGKLNIHMQKNKIGLLNIVP